MTCIVFVGEVNPYGQDPKYALFHWPRNASGNRLREHLGLSDADYAAIPKVNLCTGKWAIHSAREAAWDLEVLNDYQVIVMLGAKVRKAFGKESLPFFRSLGHYISLPHPSGLNSIWRDPYSRQLARALMRSVAHDINWGEP